MQYIIYTDGACVEPLFKSSSSYILRTDVNMLKCDVVAFRCKYITEAETIAILRAMKTLLDLNILNSEDIVMFYTDSLKAVNIARVIWRGDKVEQFSKFSYYKSLEKTISKIKEIGCRVTFNKVAAHRTNHNSNKLADKLCKYAIENLPAQDVKDVI